MKSIFDRSTNRLTLHLRNNERVRELTFDEAKANAEKGLYGYYVVHGYNKPEIDDVRQRKTLGLYDENRKRNLPTSPMFFLCGYKFPKSFIERGLTHLVGKDNPQEVEQMFGENRSVAGLRGPFPKTENLEFSDAHNSIENVNAIAHRAYQEKARVVYLTSKNHVERLRYIAKVFFEGSDNLEHMDIVGVNTPADTKWNGFYEKYIALPTTKLLLFGLRGSSPDTIMREYNKRRYNPILKAVGKLVRSHYGK